MATIHACKAPRNGVAVTAGVLALLAAGNASAVNLYSDGDSTVDLYGRLVMGAVHDDASNAGNDVDDFGSRIGLSGRQEFRPDTYVFANAEFRFDAEQRRTDSEGVFDDLRNTYFGIEGLYGRATFGNFDSLYKQNVSYFMDAFENAGERALGVGSTHARGRTLALESPRLGGVRFGVAAKHYAEDDTPTGDEEVNVHAYAAGEHGDLSWGVGVDQKKEDTGDTSGGGATGDTLVGGSVTYAFTSALDASALVEVEGDLTHFGVAGGYDYGLGSLYGTISYLEDDDTGEDGTQFGVGASYDLADAMYVFAEYNNGTDDPAINEIDDSIVTVGARYDF